MENGPREPEQGLPGDHPARRTDPRSSAGSPPPRWLWPLVLCTFGFIFWKFTPDASPAVHFSPWFLDQVKADNINSLRIRGTEIRGQLRVAVPAQAGASARSSPIIRFITHAPSADTLAPPGSIASRSEDRPPTGHDRIRAGESTQHVTMVAARPVPDLAPDHRLDREDSGGHLVGLTGGQRLVLACKCPRVTCVQRVPPELSVNLRYNSSAAVVGRRGMCRSELLIGQDHLVIWE